MQPSHLRGMEHQASSVLAQGCLFCCFSETQRWELPETQVLWGQRGLEGSGNSYDVAPPPPCVPFHASWIFTLAMVTLVV